MKLHSPQFLRALRRGVKEAIRSSPELKKEFRQAKKYRRQISANGFIRVCLAFFVGLMVYPVTNATGRPLTGLALIALWTFGWIFIHAQTVLMLTHRQLDILALRLFPVPE